MQAVAALIVALYSVLMPTKSWYAPDEKLLVKIDADQPVTLVLTDFQGLRIATDVPARVEGGATVDVRSTFPAMRVGTYILYATPVAVPMDRATREYIGTPLVIELRGDDRPGATSGTIVVKVEPLCVAKIETTAGPMVAAFYYGDAPNTVANFISLARGGFYDGLMFHRILPNFVVQAGDPLGDGSGGPGYTIPAEFNTKPHLEGVLSMAREGDPMESQGAMPRPEYANTAGSQFFICLNYEKTKHLDRKYTAFGQLVHGLDALHKLGETELADASTGRPKTPPKIKSIEIVPVRAGEDPYPIITPEEQARMDQAESIVNATTQAADPASTQPATEPPSTMPAADAASRGPSTISSKVIEIVSEQMGVDKTQIIRDTSFAKDLSADELDLVELVMEYEDEFNISIPDADAEKLKTVGQVIEYITAHVPK